MGEGYATVNYYRKKRIIIIIIIIKRGKCLKNKRTLGYKMYITLIY